MLDLTTRVQDYWGEHELAQDVEGYEFSAPDGVYVFDNYDEWVVSLTEEIAGRLEEAVPGDGFLVSTGGTPIDVYRRMTTDLRDRFASLLKDLVIVNQDEYVGISKDHPISYHRYTRERLLEPLGINEDNWIIPDPEKDPEEALAEFTDKLQRLERIYAGVFGFGADASENHPASNHIGFIEPGTPLNVMAANVELDARTREANFKPGDPLIMLALTHGPASAIRVLNKMSMGTGSHKRNNARQTIIGGYDRMVPAQLLLHKDPGLKQTIKFFLDNKAAEVLMRDLAA